LGARMPELQVLRVADVGTLQEAIYTCRVPWVSRV
jgi:hypothetical protein